MTHAGIKNDGGIPNQFTGLIVPAQKNRIADIAPSMRFLKFSDLRADPSGTVSAPVRDTSDWRVVRASSARVVPAALRLALERLGAPCAGVLSPGV